MFDKIISTFSAKLFVAVINVLTVILTTKYLGAEGQGTIGLAIASIAIAIQLSGLIGGPALVYLVAKNNPLPLVINGYLWSFIICAGVFMFLKVLPVVPENIVTHISCLSLLQSLLTINLMVLLGKEQVSRNNFITALQSVLHLVVLFGLMFFLERIEVASYFIALYISLFTGLVISSFLIRKIFYKLNISSLRPLFMQAMRFGAWVQIGNLAQLLNYRLAFYLLFLFVSPAAVGIYSVGVKISESVWLIGGSVAMVLYSRISNAMNEEYARKLTVKLVKFVLVLTFASLVPLLLVPDSFYELIFGSEFGDVGGILLIQAVGIVVFGTTIVITHYFSGIGKYEYNTYASVFGLILTFGLGFWLIPKYHVTGAAVTGLLSYLFTALFSIVLFMWKTKTPIAALIPAVKDIQEFNKSFKSSYVRNFRNNKL